MAISSIGVGSGLPIDELLNDLRKSENHALSLIQNRQVQAESRLSAYGTLKGGLSKLAEAAAALGKAENFGAVKATTSGDAFTATATHTAIAGQYSIQVTQLASSQTLAAQGLASRTDQNGTGGTISFTTQNGTQTIDLSEEGTSLNSIVEAINSNPDLGVKATIVNDGNPDNPHRLLLTSSNTGTENAVTNIEVSGNSTLAGILNYDAADPSANSMQQQAAATNAQATINGIEITSASNTIENVIEGVTVTLKGTTPTDGTESLTIAEDNSVTTKAIKEFVSAYNALNSSIRSLTSYDVENQQGSALTGDSLARRLQSDVRSTLNFFGSEGDVRSLSQMGITVDVKTGNLEIDDDKLTKAIENNMTDVKNVFTNATGGIAASIKEVDNSFNRSGGLISITTDGINKSIADIQKQYQVASDRIDAKMEAYRKQFSALDTMLAQMNGISSYLTQQLAMLPNLNASK